MIAQNDAPVALDDAYIIDEDGSLALTLLDNDKDPDGDTIWLASLSSAAHGYIVSSENTYTYYPYPNWNGTDTLTYQVSDGRTTAQASVTITVNSINDKPDAWSDWYELPQNVTGEHATYNVMENDGDPDTGDVIHMYKIVTPPQYGTAFIETNGYITYTRTGVSPESNGADSFVYRIIDRSDTTGDYSSDDATVHIGEEYTSSLNTYDRSITCNEDADAFNTDLSISNPNNVPYTLTIDSTTTLGTFTVLDNNTVRFKPAANQNGYANINYTVEQTDGGEKDTGTIYLRVYPVNDVPVIDSAPASVSMDEDTSGGSTFDVVFHDPDCADQYLYFYVYTLSATTTAPIPFQSSYAVSRDGGDARVTITTAANVNGTGKILVGVSDGMNYDEAVIDLTVMPVDDAPVVADEARTIYEDTSVTFASPGSDSEADGDVTKESILTSGLPKHGTATIRSNHTILYVPEANFFGTDDFFVTITDQTTAALSSTAKVIITVTPVNDQPEISDLGYYQSTPEDTAKDVTFTAVDVDNDITGSGHYTLTSSDQSLVKDENISISHVSGNQMKIHIVPEANANGKLVVNVVASDGSLTAEGEFELKIIPVNDVPVAANDAASVDEVVSTGLEPTAPRTTKTFNLLENDSDVEDGKPKIVSITNVVNGTVTNAGNGDVTVSADGDFNGDVTFTYTVMDRAGAKDSATVTVTVNPVNDPPRAKDDTLTIDEDATPTISVLNNDSDPENDPITITAVSTPDHGTAQINGTKVDYVPAKDYNGSDSFTYTISDGKKSASAHVRITIKPVNDAPTIEKHVSNLDDWTMDEDTTEPFHFVVADAESAVSSLIIKITSLDEDIIKTAQIALSTNEAGYKTITVTPVLNANGVAHIKFRVSDGLLSTEVVYTITIASVNDAPVVTAAKQETKEDTILSASATATDADGDSLTFSKASNPEHGTVAVTANGTYVYTPAADFNGEDSFIIAADDGKPVNHVGYATVYITVKPDGDPPVAGDDSITIDEDIETLIPVLDNDSDPDLSYGDEISIYRVSTPAHGTAVVSDGGILYKPAPDYNGTDAFTYTLADKDGKTDTASVSIFINPVNDAPRGGDDTATVQEDHSVTINAAANDDVDETTNPALEDVKITDVDDPAHGTAVIDTGSKTITYTPDENWFSPADQPEVFYYTAKDSSNQTARFAISVTVTSVNDLPVITPGDLPNISTNEDTETSAVTFTVRDVETAAGALTVTATHNNSTLLPSITVTPNAAGECSFTVLPQENKVGTATVTVTVTDANGGQDSDTFTLTVIAVNDPPSATNDSFSVAENSSRLYNVLENDDVDILDGNGGDTLTLLPDITPQYGTATVENNQLRYVPNANRTNTANYTDVFTYKMKDSSNIEATATVTVTVTPVNDAPFMSVIANVTGILEDAPNGTGDISFTVTDEEDDDDTLSITIESSNTALFPLSNITVTNPTDDPTGSVRTVKAIPAANQFGTGNIKLTVRDAGKLTYSRTFSVTVTSVNDVPTDGNKSFTVVEDIEKQLDVLKDIDADYATTPADFTVADIVSQPSHGSVRIAADNKSVYYKTAKDSNEPDSFQYKMHDSYGNADYTFTISITVTPVNDAPVITYNGSASYEIYEGTSQNDIPFTVTDVDNVTYAGGTPAVEVTLSAKSSNSILLKNGINIDTLAGNNRNIDLHPYLKWNGTTTVTITATDPGRLSSTASFVLTVNNVNDKPVALNDTGTIQEDATTPVYVLANDTDDDLLTNPDTESIKVYSVTDNDPNATIVAGANKLSILVTPNANYNGPVSFSYTIADALGAESNSATVNLTVQQVNDPPVVVNDSETTPEDVAKDIYVLDNDSDVDMVKLLNANPGAESISVLLNQAGLTVPAHGSVSTNGTKITYTPLKDYNGTDEFNYYCYDGDVKVKGTVTMTITQVNDSPVAVADTAITNEDTPTDAIDVLSNDTDVDTGSALNQNQRHSSDTFRITNAHVADEDSGSATISENKLVFSPATNWFGTAVVFYTFDDGHDASATGRLEITVNSVNDPPVFDTAPEDMTLSEDGPNGTTNIVVSDVETAAANLGVTVVSSTNTALIAVTDVTVTAGELGARTIHVNPKNDQNGSAIITLKVTDEDGGERTIPFTVDVTAVNDDPVANDKTLNIAEDAGTQTIAKSSVASDVDIETNDDALTLTIATAAQHGTAGIDTDGNLTYRAIANFNGTDTFVYTATDKAGRPDNGTVTVNISQVNDAPAVGDDSAETSEDTPVVIPVLVDDSDVDMDPLLNATPGAESISVLVNQTGLTGPAHGSVATNGSKVTYTPNQDYNGTDTFEYYCYDGEARTKGTVTVSIAQVNDNPVAIADSGSTKEDQSISVNVLGNDTDVDTDTSLNKDELHDLADLAIDRCYISGISHGTATKNGASIEYDPDADFYGTQIIKYVLIDGHGGTSTGTLTIEVGSENDAPVALEDAMSAAEDHAASVNVLENDTDVDTGDTKTFVGFTRSTSGLPGTFATNANGDVTFTPDANYNGTFSIDYQMRDTGGLTSIAKLTVTITPVNDKPTADDENVVTDEDTQKQIDVSGLIADADILTNDDALTVTVAISGEPQHGEVLVSGTMISYTPDANFNGADEIVYTATDKTGEHDSGKLSITVNPRNDAPKAVSDAKATEEDKALDIMALANDTDVDTDEMLNASPAKALTIVSVTNGTHGSAVTDGNKIVYTPDHDYNGTDKIVIRSRTVKSPTKRRSPSTSRR